MKNSIKQFLIDNVHGKTCEELAKLTNNVFGTKYTKEQIKYYKHKFGITSGLDCTFKKNCIPHNKRQTGYEFICDGYTWIKVSNKFVLKHRYIYKKEHGDIPKGYSIAFLDGDKTNFDLDNLVLIRDKDKLVMKNKHLFTSDKELTKTGILLAQVINKTHECKCNKEAT